MNSERYWPLLPETRATRQIRRDYWGAPPQQVTCAYYTRSKTHQRGLGDDALRLNHCTRCLQ